MKMKKILLILAVLLVYVPAFLCAQSRIVDNADLLSASEKADLERQLAAIASTYNFDLVIVTEESIGGAQPAAYADDFYDNGGYGADGCLFLRVTGSRDYWYSTSGSGEKILNNTAYGKLNSDVGRFLDNNDFFSASSAFINAWDEFLFLDAKYGRSYNFFYRYNVLLVLIGWVLAALIGFFIVQNWKAQMNTAIPQKQADPYITPNSLAFTGKKDGFLYTNTTKTPRASSSSGGVGAHLSSSGRSHGGRGGRR
jgi:uncharacterized protein